MNDENGFEGLGKILKTKHANCFEVMKPKIIQYTAKESLTIGFPVLEEYLNPDGRMQGGFITAAFDNTFGALCFYEVKDLALPATIDISTSYQRPIFMGDELIITVDIKSMGNTIVHMTGDARNREGKLVATSTTNIMLLKDDTKIK
ncbi:PaaI family thioesterase [Clostridium sp. HMP27]|uniref:PaaI family thioesterase n=1 Tax=Clostridium sp. HMP27 TaxID=1487921 RepID=UPI00068BA8F8|nr:PaaI family thioesterase [Clostridium sp. HMP27]